MLTPKIHKYIGNLTEKLPEIRSIWLFGSRANGNARDSSDWDLLVFGDVSTFNSVKNDEILHLKEVDLMIVSGDEFSRPYGEPKHGSLKKWNWELKSENIATYDAVKWYPHDNSISKRGLQMGALVKQKLRAVRVY